MWYWRPRDLWLHHAGSGPTNTANGASEARLCLNKGSSGDTTTSSATNARASNRRCGHGLGTRLFGRRRAFDSHGNYLFAPEKDKAKSAAVLALLVSVVLLSLGGRKLTKLFAVAEDEVHVAVESHEFADKLPAVLDRDTHPVIYELKHLRTL